MKPGIIITAAGRAERFQKAGGTGNKLNACLSDCTVFAQTLRHAQLSGLAIHVVTRPENSEIQAVCRAQRVPVTLIDSNGLGESIAAGVCATPDWHGWLIHLADMPFVPPAVFLQVADALDSHKLTRPRADAQPGHPVGFARSWYPKLCLLTGDGGARELLHEDMMHFVDIDDAGSQRDIDLPSHLAQRSEHNHATS